MNNNNTRSMQRNNGSTTQNNKTPLQMSFLDWKKSKELAETFPNDGKINKKSIQSTSHDRAKQLPVPLTFGSINTSNVFNLRAMAKQRKHSNRNTFSFNLNESCNNTYRPLEPPPFWEDMICPQLQSPPMQLPIPPINPKYSSRNNDKFCIRQNFKPIRKSFNDSSSQQEPAAAIAKPFADTSMLTPPPPPPPSPPPSSLWDEKLKKRPPKVLTDGKTMPTAAVIATKQPKEWVQKPSPPPPIDDNDPDTKLERQRMWREYRQAMKPFKNRDFHNAKRVVQRLSKLSESELDERQRDRLQKALEFVNAHKTMLSHKHAERWVPTEPDTVNNGTSEKPKVQIYVRKAPEKNSDKWLHLNATSALYKLSEMQTKNYCFGRAIRGCGNKYTTQNETESPAPQQGTTLETIPNTTLIGAQRQKQGTFAPVRPFVGHSYGYGKLSKFNYVNMNDSCDFRPVQPPSNVSAAIMPVPAPTIAQSSLIDFN